MSSLGGTETGVGTLKGGKEEVSKEEEPHQGQESRVSWNRPGRCLKARMANEARIPRSQF